MAKWGEGDPRWIVEERPDGTNVNNWHWTEKNATAWSKELLHQLFQNFPINHYDIECNITNMETCNGEAIANNRKGKLIIFYEWEMKLRWQGRLLNHSGIYHTGKLIIRKFSEENKIHDVDIIVAIDESNDESEQIKRFMLNMGRDKIRHLLNTYISEFKKEYSKILLLPKKCVNNVTTTKANDAPTTTTTTTTITTTLTNTPSTSQSHLRQLNMTKADLNDAKNDVVVVDVVECKIDDRHLHMCEQFQCNAKNLYKALTKVDMIKAFTRSSAKIDPIKNGEFHLYDDYVNGKFLELIPDEKLIFTWRLKSWPLGHYSTVKIDIKQFDDYTQLTMEQYDIPASAYDSMKSNWYRYYWHNIKRTFGFGSTLTNYS